MPVKGFGVDDPVGVRTFLADTLAARGEAVLRRDRQR